jgi:glutathione S-transferase
MPLLVAEELAVPYELTLIYDMTAVGAEVYAGNPALKLPILQSEGRTLFGAQNICRAVAERAQDARRIVWPEEQRDDLSRNAQELVWHSMATQVQLVMGTMVNKLPAENPYFAKLRAGMEGSLRWLDSNLRATLGALPPRDLSLFEVSLYCLVEHVSFRGTFTVEPYPQLVEFCREFGQRAAAQKTAYRFDTPTP